MHRILIVDDEPEIEKLLEEFLKKKGFEVLATSNPEKALEILESDAKIDLIVLDMRMPKMKGIDILKTMKRINRVTPVVILTGSIDAQTYDEELGELGYGLDDVCYKPVDLMVLLEAIEKKLGLNLNKE